MNAAEGGEQRTMPISAGFPVGMAPPISTNVENREVPNNMNMTIPDFLRRTPSMNDYSEKKEVPSYSSMTPMRSSESRDVRSYDEFLPLGNSTSRYTPPVQEEDDDDDI